MKTLGIDGCRAGWFAVTRSARRLSWQVAESLTDILAPPRPARVFIDMPIGLAETGRRDCDALARRMLGPGFSSSVFPTPARRALQATSYPEANALNRQHAGQGLSKQSYFLFPKIRELDGWLARVESGERRPREAHPEVAFLGIKGEPLQHKKKTPAGFSERLSLLSGLDARVQELVEDVLAGTRRKDVAADDILDACCLALMPLAGRLRSLPARPARDARGLAMEICYCGS